ncbi:MAG: tRNA dihydrouridine(20/20a) synthase DusA [Spirochaetales bacterium]|nr:tRNA dihydrouridine(20/20a) synthase DusA [Leptospiraceae bacterium]MCP5480005.1 tRNA dihydrouridine(20/20a) synthase DusA [Spirochaetales bacterium]MCP5485654.1 tRNA dihydrouridine(20/20a) synthase DusA [Spirochaetales bacterium]
MNPEQNKGFRISIAPMMDWTDRYYRFFMRGITRECWLYTEMIVARAILNGDAGRLLAFDEQEHPIVLQIGGDRAQDLARATRIGADFGYDEINLNVGCPSDRVQGGNFGACLMAEPERVADMVCAMAAATRLPITVKHRIGIPGADRYEDLARFVELVSRAGCTRFIVHARIALLNGLSPKENRTVPPLRYADVYQLKSEFPHVTVEINGGIRSLESIQAHLRHVDGVMIGRAAYEDPFLFASIEEKLFGNEPKTRESVVAHCGAFLEQLVKDGSNPHRLTRHMLGLFYGQPGARAWRRLLSDQRFLKTSGARCLEHALRQRADERELVQV